MNFVKVYISNKNFDAGTSFNFQTQIEHDIVAEDIQVILTESQFKMHKYYDSWEEYKCYFKKYHCRAAFTNPEEDKKRNASINYQMLQSLTDITDDEIKDIAKLSVDKLNHFCDSKKSVLEFFGVVPENVDPTYFQQGIMLYENLLNDEYTKKVLRDNKNSSIVEMSFILNCLSKKYNYSQKEIASLMNLSRSQITNIMRLQKLDQWILNDIANDKLSFGHVRAISTLNKTEMEEIIKLIYEKHLSVRDVEKIVYEKKHKVNFSREEKIINKKFKCTSNE